jgi:hypothetical protein
LVLFGDVEARSVPGLVFPKEAAGVNFAALYLLDELLRDLSRGVDRRGTGAVSVLLGGFPIIVLHRLLAGSRDVGGVDNVSTGVEY